MIELNKYFKLNELYLNVLGGNTELYRSRKNSDIYLPAIFFSLSAVLENSALISVSLNILSNYIYDELKGKIGIKNVHAELYIETKEKGKLTKISYKGDVEGLKSLEKVIKGIK
jgi:hypothetical protein